MRRVRSCLLGKPFRFSIALVTVRGRRSFARRLHSPRRRSSGTDFDRNCSEVHRALTAQEILAAQNVKARVISLPCRELFDEQPDEYRKAVLLPTLRARAAVEAGATLAWGRYVGLDGATVGLDRFGASAPRQVVVPKNGDHSRGCRRSRAPRKALRLSLIH